ncbi:MAG: peptidase MA domain-containing protein [Dehalococcoidia bacterium]|nr:peptidase MA domain-containing protein [Dehalococcoidia bacterium]
MVGRGSQHAARSLLRVAVLLALLGLGLASPRPGAAQDTLHALDTNVTVDFPTSITFHVEARGPRNITRAEVRFRVEQRSCALAESSGLAQFQPGQRVSTSWTWDTRKGGDLPPGALVRYRWILRDASGEVVEAPEQTYEVADDRYSWQSLRQGPLTINWYRGDTAFGTALMAASQDALGRLDRSAGARPERPVKLFIYGSTEDLQGALVFPPEWTGGVAFGGFNIIAISIPPASLAWGQRALAHELTHVIVDQVAFNCFRDIPTWLNEGLATYNEDASGNPLPSYADALKGALDAGGLISVRGLGGGFPTSAQQATLAYGESFSLVQYLTQTYGPEKLGTLLTGFRAGTTADAALTQVYGFDQDGLEAQWRRHIGAPPMSQAQQNRTPVPLAPAIPTFEPYTVSTPTPALEATPGSTRAVAEATPTVRPLSWGSCNAGLPMPTNAGSHGVDAATPLLGPLVLAGLALATRRRKR